MAVSFCQAILDLDLMRPHHLVWSCEFRIVWKRTIKVVLYVTKLPRMQFEMKRDSALKNV